VFGIPDPEQVTKRRKNVIRRHASLLALAVLSVAGLRAGTSWGEEIDATKMKEPLVVKQGDFTLELKRQGQAVQHPRLDYKFQPFITDIRIGQRFQRADGKREMWTAGVGREMRLILDEKQGSKIVSLWEKGSRRYPDMDTVTVHDFILGTESVTLNATRRVLSSNAYTNIGHCIYQILLSPAMLEGAMVTFVSDGKAVDTSTLLKSEEAEKAGKYSWGGREIDKLLIESPGGSMSVFSPTGNKLGFQWSYRGRSKRWEASLKFHVAAAKVSEESNASVSFCFGKEAEAEVKKGKALIEELKTRKTRVPAGKKPTAAAAQADDSPAPLPSWVPSCVGNQAWQMPGWKYRVPIVVHNPGASAREFVPVRVRLTLPEGATPSSVRVNNQIGEELAFQAGTQEGEGFSLLFLANVPPGMWRAYYVYLGNGAAKAPKYTSMVSETDTKWRVDNGPLQVEFLKMTGLKMPTLASFKPDDLISGFAGLGLWGKFPTGIESTVAEQGPVMAKIAYPGLEFTFVKGAPSFVVTSRRICMNLHLYESHPGCLTFPTEEGRKEVKLTHKPGGRWGTTPQKVAEVPEEIAGNWLEFSGDKGSVGIVFNRKGKRTVMVTDDSINQRVNVSRGEALVCVNRDPSKYAERFSYSLRTYQLSLQKADDLPLERIPTLGKDFVLMSNLSTGDYSFLLDFQRFVRSCKFLGANMQCLGAALHTYWESELGNSVGNHLPALIETAKRYRVGLMLNVQTRGRIMGQKVHQTEHEYFWHKRIEEFCSYPDIQGFYVFDEACAHWADETEQAFEEKYGRKPAQIMRYSRRKKDTVEFYRDKLRFSNPEFFDILKFRVDHYTAMCREYVEEAARHKRDDIVIMTAQSPGGQYFGGWAYPWTYVDMRALHDAGTYVSIDPYGEPTPARRSQVRFLTACRRYQAPLTIIGTTSRETPQHLRNQAILNTFFGGKSIWVFQYKNLLTQKTADVLAYYYDFLWNIKNNLGDLLVGAKPVPFAGVLWSSDSHLAYLKAEGTGIMDRHRGTSYDYRILGYGRLAAMPWDYVFASDIDDILPHYKVMFLPVDRYMPRETIGKLLDYAEAGGVLVLDGESLEVHPEFREALGVAKATAKESRSYVASEEVILSKVYQLDLADKNTMVLGHFENEEGKFPLAISVQTGKGRILYIASSLNSFLREYSGKANQYLKRIIAPHAAWPVQTDQLVEPLLWKGDDYYLIGLGNLIVSEARNVKVAVPAIPADWEVFDLLEGSPVPVAGTGDHLEFDIRLGDWDVKFLRAGPKDTYRTVRIETTSASPWQFEGYREIPEGRVRGENRVVVMPSYIASVDKAKSAGRIAVGVVNGGGRRNNATSNLVSVLNQAQDVAAFDFPYQDAFAEVIRHFDVLVFNAYGKNSPPGAADWNKVLHDYVEQGGGILLSHGSLGGISITPFSFAEIAMGRDKLTPSTLVATQAGAKRFGLDTTENYQYSYMDHFVLQRGPKARETILTDMSGMPVVVLGRDGNGKVAGCGVVFGLEPTGPVDPTGWEKDLLTGLVRWLRED